MESDRRGNKRKQRRNGEDAATHLSQSGELDGDGGTIVPAGREQSSDIIKL